jgi:hypothetical protein
MSNSALSARVSLQPRCKALFLQRFGLLRAHQSKDAKMGRRTVWMQSESNDAQILEAGISGGLKELERSRPVPAVSQRRPEKARKKHSVGPAGLGSASSFRRRFPFRSARHAQNLCNLGQPFSFQSSVAARSGEASHSSMLRFLIRRAFRVP